MSYAITMIGDLAELAVPGATIPGGGALLRGRVRQVYDASKMLTDGSFVQRVYYVIADHTGVLCLSVDSKQGEGGWSPDRRRQQGDAVRALLEFLEVDGEYHIELKASHLRWMVPIHEAHEVLARGTNLGSYISLPPERGRWPLAHRIREGVFYPVAERRTVSVPAVGTPIRMYPLPDYCAVGQMVATDAEPKIFSSVCRVLSITALGAGSTGVSPGQRGGGSGRALFRMVVADRAGVDGTPMNIFPNYPEPIIEGCRAGRWGAGDIVVMQGLVQKGKWVNMGGATRCVVPTPEQYQALRDSLPESVVSYLDSETAVPEWSDSEERVVSRFAALVEEAAGAGAGAEGRAGAGEGERTPGGTPGGVKRSLDEQLGESDACGASADGGGGKRKFSRAGKK